MKKSLEKSYDALNKITYCYGYDKNIEIVNNELKRLEELDKEFELETLSGKKLSNMLHTFICEMENTLKDPNKRNRSYAPQVFWKNKYTLEIIETALKRIDYLERVNKDLQESKDKLIKERNNKIIEHRIVYDDYNFQSIKKFVACKDCQYYENEKCSNTTGCFWLELETTLKALEIIKTKQVDIHLLSISRNVEDYNLCAKNKNEITQKEYDLLKEVLQ